MEKLTQDLFQDHEVEEKKSRVAGICTTTTAILGASRCITGGGLDVLIDVAP